MLKQIILLGVFIMAATSLASNLKPGDKAPDFALKDADGTIYKLADFKGKMVVLYFYPKDDTPGCTAEACNIRDNYQRLQDAGLSILGVSYDDAESHDKFRKKYNLPFPLLSDTAKTVAEAYGAKGTFTGFLVAQRKTYLIGKDGKLLHIFDDVDTKNHTEQILDFINKKDKKSK